jgi:hypothetical protein
MRFELPDGYQVVGRSYDAIVRNMAADKMEEPGSLRSYRKAAARRAREAHGAEINPVSNKTFILSLEREGLIRRVAGAQRK